MFKPSKFGWIAFQVGLIAVFMYGDYETDFSEGRPGMVLLAAIVIAFLSTILLTDFFDWIRSLIAKFRGRSNKDLGHGPLVPRSRSRDLSDLP